MTLAHWYCLVLAAIVPLGCGVSQPAAQGGPAEKADQTPAADSEKVPQNEPAKKPAVEAKIDRSVPDEQSLADAEKKLQTAFEADFQSATKAAQQVALAQRLIATATETQDDRPAVYVLLQSAASLATSAGDMDTAWKAWELLGGQFEVDAVQLCHDSLLKAADAARAPAQCADLVKKHDELIERCIAADRFELLEGIAESAEKLAAIGLGAEAAAAWKEQREELGALYASFAIASGAKTNLATTPEDAGSHAELGRFLCFVKEDWSRGLEHLARGSDETLKNAAEQERQLQERKIGPIALGEVWREVAGSLTGRMKDNCLARAKQHYQAGLTRGAGLDKAVALRRIDEIEGRSAGKAALTTRPPRETHAAQFTGQSHVEIRNSTGAVDLNADFTIELWARWPAASQSEYLAGDEAWPEYPKTPAVDAPCGWVLRYRTFEGRQLLDFTIAVKERRDWLSTMAPVQVDDRWHHVAACRAGAAIVLYLDGRPIAENTISGLTLVPSPTPIYLGCRKDGFTDRHFSGQIGKFRISDTARYRQDFRPQPDWKHDEETLLLYEFGKPTKEGVIDDSSGNDRVGVLSAGVSIVRLADDSIAEEAVPGDGGPASAEKLEGELPLLGIYENYYSTNNSRREYRFDPDGTVTITGLDTMANAVGPIPRASGTHKAYVLWRQAGDEFVGLIYWDQHQKFEVVTVDKSGKPRFALYVLEQQTVGTGTKVK